MQAHGKHSPSQYSLTQRARTSPRPQILAVVRDHWNTQSLTQRGQCGAGARTHARTHARSESWAPRNVSCEPRSSRRSDSTPLAAASCAARRQSWPTGSPLATIPTCFRSVAHASSAHWALEIYRRVCSLSATSSAFAAITWAASIEPTTDDAREAPPTVSRSTLSPPPSSSESPSGELCPPACCCSASMPASARGLPVSAVAADRAVRAPGDTSHAFSVGTISSTRATRIPPPPLPLRSAGATATAATAAGGAAGPVSSLRCAPLHDASDRPLACSRSMRRR